MHTASGAGVPNGWRQSDRFVGFRYHLSVSKNNKEEDVTIAIQNKAGKYVLSYDFMPSICSLGNLTTSFDLYIVFI